MEFTLQQKNYLEIILSSLRKTVIELNITPEEFAQNFEKLFTEAHNNYQEFLQYLIEDKEVQEILANDIWNELRK